MSPQISAVKDVNIGVKYWIFCSPEVFCDTKCQKDCPGHCLENLWWSFRVQTP